jgi:hypothetical protein
MDGPAGPQRSTTTTRSVVERLQGDPEGVRHEVPNNPKRCGRSRASGSPAPGEGRTPERPGQTEEYSDGASIYHRFI